MGRAVLITGGNQGDARALLRKAEAMIEAQIGRVVARSSHYESEPWGFEAEQSFWNQVLVVDTPLEPFALLDAIHEVEQALGRNRLEEGAQKAQSGARYCSRTMDVDILLYDEQVISTEQLEIPHPRMGERSFVLRPLVEVMPEHRHPTTGETFTEMLHRLEPSA